MPERFNVAEIKSFIAGLNTDASALTFPENSSLDEDNMVLNTNGSRQRRLGMDFEQGHIEITTSQIYSSSNTYAHSTFKWHNAGGNPDQSLMVVQFGNEIKFFDLSNAIISSEVIKTHLFDPSTSSSQFSYAVVDGILSVVTGEKEITSFEYTLDTDSISVTTAFLSIRDLFGVAVTIDGVNLTAGNNISTRPSNINDEHKYNLRNQSWADARVDANNETLKDPISGFFDQDSTYPANSDSVNEALYPDANDTGGRTKDRFFAKDLISNRYGNTAAAKGHYIIDAMERGTSRKAAYDQTVSESTVTLLPISSLPVDRTEGGPSVIAQYSGRNFYAGFNGALVGGDDKSPRLSSYILFSKRVEDVEDVVNCYQDGDPTSPESPDLIDTDGGFIRIDEAYGIKAMINLSNTLFILASNGVWSVTGDDQSGFTATSYSVSKIIDKGVTGTNSIVEVEGSFIYWADDGIYTISRDQFGDWNAKSITENRIDTLYAGITSIERTFVEGQYDGFDKKVRWIYRNDINNTSTVRELVLDSNIGAFYTNTIGYTPATTLPKVVGIFESNPFTRSSGTDDVVVGGVLVVANTVQVVVPKSIPSSTQRQIQYVCITDTDTVIKYTFCLYNDADFLDWKTPDGTGVDASAFLLTGYQSGGEFIRVKTVPYLTTYFNKTETGYVTDGNGDFVAVNSSSCNVQVQWEWTNNANSKRFGKVFEAYRHNRFYIPVDIDDGFDDGLTVIKTRHRLRGVGSVLSIKFSTTPGKDLQLLGWSMLIGIEDIV